MANKMQDLETENKVLRDKNILSQISSLGDTIHLELKSIRTEQQLKHDETKLTLGQILEQARKTNGRVTKTEEEIEALKLKQQELLSLANTTYSNQESANKDLQVFRFFGQFPRALWIILAILWILASNGMVKDVIDLFK